MCGICASVTFLKFHGGQPANHFKNDSQKHLKQCLERRGPDFYSEVSKIHEEKIDLFLSASVLHLRSFLLTGQPVVDNQKNALLWNGEIFDGALMEEKNEISDTGILAEKLFSSQTVHEVLQIISCIKGPYAFIFYQVSEGLLWFGRDVFGRRSLLWSLKDSVFQLCSVGVNTHHLKWEEVPTCGIFCLNLNLCLAEDIFVINQYSWSSSASGNFAHKRAELPFSDARAEIRLAPDLTVQAPISEPLNKSVPSDSSSSVFSHLITDYASKKLSMSELFKLMLELPIMRETVNNFETVLSHSVKRRVQEQLKCCKLCYSKLKENNFKSCCDHSYTGVLFSGGLDSIVIANLADKYVDSKCSIDLINVAFASHKNIDIKTKKVHFDTPDRITGRTGYEALKNLSSSRRWRFVEVNVMDSELNEKRGPHISELLYPSCTVLDDSIGCALWFASQGKGFTIIDGEHEPYKSPARVLLVGMGADEQLAGYSRHRAKYKNSGWNGLVEEIAIELDRIGSRNLGRDDRIISDNGVESRYPFLDENVVSFLNSLPIWLKTNLNFDRGVGEKLLLRLLAFKLNLTEAAVLPKRAIQFGSRIAKLENHKEKGSDVCERLLQSIS